MPIYRHRMPQELIFHSTVFSMFNIGYPSISGSSTLYFQVP
uniref:Uncharacterized protein n=1 Tax=Anguilla anguilla TaxID=7936 RepID=A0A0E9VKY4_ANGAN